VRSREVCITRYSNFTTEGPGSRKRSFVHVHQFRVVLLHIPDDEHSAREVEITRRRVSDTAFDGSSYECAEGMWKTAPHSNLNVFLTEEMRRSQATAYLSPYLLITDLCV